MKIRESYGRAFCKLNESETLSFPSKTGTNDLHIPTDYKQSKKRVRVKMKRYPNDSHFITNLISNSFIHYPTESNGSMLKNPVLFNVSVLFQVSMKDSKPNSETKLDCTSCRIIGTLGLFATATYVFINARKHAKTYNKLFLNIFGTSEFRFVRFLRFKCFQFDLILKSFVIGCLNILTLTIHEEMLETQFFFEKT